MDLLSHLRALARSDIDAIVATRPDAARIAGGGTRRRLETLAATLAQPRGVSEAVAGLDRFHRQLLLLAGAFGHLERAVAADQGVPTDRLEPAGRALARRALAFPRDGVLSVPDEVRAAISLGRSLGASLRVTLESHTKHSLHPVGRALGTRVATKDGLIDGIERRLSDPSFVRALLAGAPPEARRALEVIRRSGTEARIYSLVDELGSGVYQFNSGYQEPGGKDPTGLHWLQRHGLIFRDPWESRVLITAPVEVAIRGRAFATWETEPPQPELVPAVFDHSPLSLIEEMTRLVQILAQAELPMLKSVEIGVREVRRLATELGTTESSVRWLLAVGRHAGLLGIRAVKVRRAGRRSRWEPVEENRFIAVTDRGRSWLAADPAEAWLTVFRGWLMDVETRARYESTATGTGEQMVLRALLELPPGQAATPASLARRLSWLAPAVWEADEHASAAVTGVLASLTALGLSPTSGAAAVSDLGRAAIAGEPLDAVKRLLPVGVECCTVQADLTVIVGGPPSVELGAALARFADLQTADVARIYRLTTTSVRRALDQGTTAQEIEGFLAERSGGELPSPVREFIRDLGRRHGRLRVGSAAVYVVGEDAAVVAETVASRTLRSLRLRQVAPTVAVVEGKTVAQVVDAMRKSGLMPVVEAAAEAEPEPEPPAASRRRGAPTTEMAEYSAPRSGRRPLVTDPEQLERRRLALVRARAARAEKLQAAIRASRPD